MVTAIISETRFRPAARAASGLKKTVGFRRREEELSVTDVSVSACGQHVGPFGFGEVASDDPAREPFPRRGIGRPLLGVPSRTISSRPFGSNTIAGSVAGQGPSGLPSRRRERRSQRLTVSPSTGRLAPSGAASAAAGYAFRTRPVMSNSSATTSTVSSTESPRHGYSTPPVGAALVLIAP
jgi:hypothetical protein